MKNGNQDFSQFFTSYGHAMEEFHKLNMNTAKQLSELQLSFMNLCLKCNCDQMERLAKAETPSDFVATESGIATEYMSKFANNAQETFDTLNKFQDAMFSWMQDNNFMGQLGTTAEDKTRTAKKTASATQ